MKALIIDDSIEAAELVRDILRAQMDVEVVGLVRSVDEALGVAGYAQPGLVLLDTSAARGELTAAVGALHTVTATAPVIITSADADPGTMREAIMAGARDFLPKPISPADLLDAVRRIGPIIPQQHVQRSDAPVQSDEACVVTLYSPKGGTGVTTLATNLAVAKRLETGARVAVVDLSLPYGDVGLALDVRTTSSLYDLCMHAGELDTSLLNDVMVTHATGVRVLVAPADPQQAESISADQVRKVLEQVALSFDYVFIDTSRDLNDNVLAALDRASHVLLVGTQDVAAVRNLRTFSAIAQLLDYSKDKLQLVINRQAKYYSMAPNEIAQRLGMRLLGTVAEDSQLFAEAGMRGVPVAILKKGSVPTRQIASLASAIRGQHLGAYDLNEPGSRSKKGLSLFRRSAA